VERILLVTNAEAGTNDKTAVDEALAVLREHADVKVAATTDAHQLHRVLADRDGRDVVVAGGDGSLHAVIRALSDNGDLSSPTLGLIPLGTGNDFARGVDIPLLPAEAAAVIVDGRTTKVDVLVDGEGGIVVNAVHVGVGAEAGREAAPWKWLGKLGYVVGAAKAGFKSRGHRMRVVADDTVLADGHRRVFQVGIANGPNIGGGTKLSPHADPTDGSIDVLVSFSVKRRDRFLYGVHLKRGTHEERHDVRTVRARRVSVSGDGFWCNADGELAGPITSREWRLQPDAFAMRLPTPAQETLAE